MKFVGAALSGAFFLCALPPTSHATHVHMEAGPFLGVVLCVAVDPARPKTIYASAFGGGVFRSEDGGQAWAAVNRGLPNRKVFSLVIDPKDRKQLYLGTDQGIFLSRDQGNSWAPLTLQLARRNVRAFAIDAKDARLLYVATDQGVFQGREREWTRISAGLLNPDVRGLVVSRDGDLFAATFDGVFKKEKRRSSWSEVNRGLEDRKIRALAIDPASHGTLFAGTSYGGAFRTTDGGKSWKAANRGLLNSTVLSLIITPDGALYAGTIDGVFKSLTHGQSWFAAGEDLPFTVASMAFDPSDPKILYAGSGGRVFKSNNGGQNWKDISRHVSYFVPVTRANNK